MGGRLIVRRSGDGYRDRPRIVGIYLKGFHVSTLNTPINNTPRCPSDEVADGH